MTTSPHPSDEPVAPKRRSSAERRVAPERRVVTMAPSPWRRRKRARPWWILSTTTNVLMILTFVALLAFAWWEAESREAGRGSAVSHARVRPGESATPLPERPDPAR